MREPGATSSRDDIPMNAFALLPPFVANEAAHVPLDELTSSTAPERLPYVADAVDEVDVDVGVENPMRLLKLNLAHTELRETIEALYGTINVLEQKIGGLGRENTRLVECNERIRAETAVEEAKSRERLQARDHQVTQLQHTIRDLERTNERLNGDMSELQEKLDERDRTIADLQDAFHELERQQPQQTTDGESHLAEEILQLKEIWSSKERSVAETTDHVRQATAAVQRFGEQLQSQLKHVQAELQTTEKIHDSCRRHLAVHKCTNNSTQQLQQHDETPIRKELTAVRDQLRSMEIMKVELATHNKVLQAQSVEYKASIQLLTSQLSQLRTQLDAKATLLTKYESSTADGTETIAELNESLVKLCSQLSEERKHHHERLTELLQVATEKENGLQRDLEAAEENLKKVRDELECTKQGDKGMVPPCPNCNGERAQERCTPPTTVHPVTLTHSGPTDCLQTPTSNKRSRAAENQELPLELQTCKVVHNVSASPARRVPTELPTTGDDHVGASIHQEAKVATYQGPVVCRICDEEPFGFMVRCQKCKDPFHAGCIKNTASGAKKRLGHIFKCSSCAPQRPTKMARNNHTNTGENLSVAVPLQVVPSRSATMGSPGGVSRPPQQR